MLDRLKEFFIALTGEHTDEAVFDETDKRLAAAALMVHCMEVDGVTRPEERVTLRATLKETFELDDTLLEGLIAEARNADYEAVDLYSFTSVLKRRMSEEERMHVIEMMWELVYSDGVVHELEDNLVWRVTELLGLSNRDRMVLKKKVETARQNDGAAS